tara:strand:+ start:306 stop:416 length:111 start_codon:yes stop_codon:yes gene_type:complete
MLTGVEGGLIEPKNKKLDEITPKLMAHFSIKQKIPY